MNSPTGNQRSNHPSLQAFPEAPPSTIDHQIQFITDWKELSRALENPLTQDSAMDEIAMSGPRCDDTKIHLRLIDLALNNDCPKALACISAIRGSKISDEVWRKIVALLELTETSEVQKAVTIVSAYSMSPLPYWLARSVAEIYASKNTPYAPSQELCCSAYHAQPALVHELISKALALEGSNSHTAHVWLEIISLHAIRGEIGSMQEFWQPFGKNTHGVFSTLIEYTEGRRIIGASISELGSEGLAELIARSWDGTREDSVALTQIIAEEIDTWVSACVAVTELSEHPFPCTAVGSAYGLEIEPDNDERRERATSPCTNLDLLLEPVEKIRSQILGSSTLLPKDYCWNLHANISLDAFQANRLLGFSTGRGVEEIAHIFTYVNNSLDRNIFNLERLHQSPTGGLYLIRPQITKIEGRADFSRYELKSPCIHADLDTDFLKLTMRFLSACTRLQEKELLLVQSTIRSALQDSGLYVSRREHSFATDYDALDSIQTPDQYESYTNQRRTARATLSKIASKFLLNFDPVVSSL